MAQGASHGSIKISRLPRLPNFNRLASPTRHFNAIPPRRHQRLSLLSTALPPDHGLIVLADYVPQFPRIFDAPVKDFIAPDVPLLPGFNADNMNQLFLPDIINTTNLYYLLLFISCAVAVVYLEIGALVNDFIQEKDFEELEDQFLQQQEQRAKNKNEEMIATKVKPLSPEEIAYKERKRGLGWLAIITAAAIWCTGILNKINPFQP